MPHAAPGRRARTNARQQRELGAEVAQQRHEPAVVHGDEQDDRQRVEQRQRRGRHLRRGARARRSPSAYHRQPGMWRRCDNAQKHPAVWAAKTPVPLAVKHELRHATSHAAALEVQRCSASHTALLLQAGTCKQGNAYAPHVLAVCQRGGGNQPSMKNGPQVAMPGLWIPCDCCIWCILPMTMAGQGSAERWQGRTLKTPPKSHRFICEPCTTKKLPICAAARRAVSWRRAAARHGWMPLLPARCAAAAQAMLGHAVGHDRRAPEHTHGQCPLDPCFALFGGLVWQHPWDMRGKRASRDETAPAAPARQGSWGAPGGRGARLRVDRPVQDGRQEDRQHAHDHAHLLHLLRREPRHAPACAAGQA